MTNKTEIEELAKAKNKTSMCITEKDKNPDKIQRQDSKIIANKNILFSEANSSAIKYDA